MNSDVFWRFEDAPPEEKEENEEAKEEKGEDY